MRRSRRSLQREKLILNFSIPRVTNPKKNTNLSIPSKDKDPKDCAPYVINNPDLSSSSSSSSLNVVQESKMERKNTDDKNDPDLSLTTSPKPMSTDITDSSTPTLKSNIDIEAIITPNLSLTTSPDKKVNVISSIKKTEKITTPNKNSAAKLLPAAIPLTSESASSLTSSLSSSSLSSSSPSLSLSSSSSLLLSSSSCLSSSSLSLSSSLSSIGSTQLSSSIGSTESSTTSTKATKENKDEVKKSSSIIPQQNLTHSPAKSIKTAPISPITSTVLTVIPKIPQPIPKSMIKFTPPIDSKLLEQKASQPKVLEQKLTPGIIETPKNEIIEYKQGKLIIPKQHSAVKPTSTAEILNEAKCGSDFKLNIDSKFNLLQSLMGCKEVDQRLILKLDKNMKNKINRNLPSIENLSVVENSICGSGNNSQTPISSPEPQVKLSAPEILLQEQEELIENFDLEFKFISVRVTEPDYSDVISSDDIYCYQFFKWLNGDDLKEVSGKEVSEKDLSEIENKDENTGILLRKNNEYLLNFDVLITKIDNNGINGSETVLNKYENINLSLYIKRDRNGKYVVDVRYGPTIFLPPFVVIDCTHYDEANQMLFPRVKYVTTKKHEMLRCYMIAYLLKQMK